jgi:DNA-binding transcriptional regulator YdaS (Cro superfamily)
MEDKPAMASALRRAIDTIGGFTVTARGLGIKPQAVAQWEICPGARVIPIERMTGGKVSRGELRPDLYPEESPRNA